APTVSAVAPPRAARAMARAINPGTPSAAATGTPTAAARPAADARRRPAGRPLPGATSAAIDSRASAADGRSSTGRPARAARTGAVGRDTPGRQTEADRGEGEAGGETRRRHALVENDGRTDNDGGAEAGGCDHRHAVERSG